MLRKNIIALCILILLSVIFLNGCSDSVITDKANEEIMEKVDSLELLYKKILENRFKDLILTDLNYDQLNSTTIIIGKQSFGDRDLLLDDEGRSTQRIICYSMNDGTQVVIILGKLFSTEQETNIPNNMITLYSENMKSIGLSESHISELDLSTNIDSSIYLFNNIIINTIFYNNEQEIDLSKVILFKETLVEVISGN